MINTNSAYFIDSLATPKIQQKGVEGFNEYEVRTIYINANVNTISYFNSKNEATYNKLSDIKN